MFRLLAVYRSVFILVVLLLVPASSNAASALKTAELVPPKASLPEHTSLALGPFDGWEPDRVQKAVLSALTDANRGLDGRDLPSTATGPGPASRPTLVLGAVADAAEGALVLQASAREPAAVDKVSHKRVNYDHRFKAVRKTELRIDFSLIDPTTGATVFSSKVTASPKPARSPWNTDEDGAIQSVPDAGTMALDVLDQLAWQIADQVAPSWALRKYVFRKAEFGEAVVEGKLVNGDLDPGIEAMLKIVDAHPESPDDHYNLALALAAAKRFEEAAEAAEKALSLDEAKATKRLLANIAKWKSEHEQLLAAGFKF